MAKKSSKKQIENANVLKSQLGVALRRDDLANFMVNPNETTVPRLLKERGYKSALFGKFHMGVQGHDPYGYAMVQALGFEAITD